VNRFHGRRIVEIGPKHGQDSRLLASLAPSELTIIDLPEKHEHVLGWLEEVRKLSPTTYREANLLYMDGATFDGLGTFDLVWCLGVLYHNVEQLRLLRKLFRLCRPGGLVVVESATTRKRRLSRLNAVEVLWPEPYRGQSTITHLPTRRAVASWLQMVGFSEVRRWDAYSRRLAWQRAVFTAVRPEAPRPYVSYGEADNPAYIAGEAL